MEKLRRTISKGLADARLAKGLSQSDLARRTGLLPAAVAHFEAARRMPTVHNLLRLADALDLSLDSLFGRDSNRTPKRSVKPKAIGRRRKQT
jgi:transcriptional regulator with XRE-family HTH domain